jgi:ERCC4-type nuclease
MENAEVVDLCLDSESEGSWGEGHPPPAPAGIFARETIDLCESSEQSSDDEEKPTKATSLPKVATTRTNNPAHPASAPAKRKASYTDGSSSEDEDLLSGGPIFSNTKSAARKISRGLCNPYGASSPERSSRSKEDPSMDNTLSMRSVALFGKPAAEESTRMPRGRSGAARIVRNDEDGLFGSLRSGMESVRKPPPAVAVAAATASATVSPTPPRTSAVTQKPRGGGSNDYDDDSRPFVYPKLLANSVQHPDLRARLALSFWKFGKNTQTRHAHQRPKLDMAAKRVVRLVLQNKPVRSMEEFLCFGKTSVSSARQVREDIREELEIGGYDASAGFRNTPVTVECVERRYYSIAEACLVTLLEHVDATLQSKDVEPQLLRALDDEAKGGYLKINDMWVMLVDLIPAIDRILRPECPGRLTRPSDDDNGAAHYLEQSTRSIEFAQIAKLEVELGDNMGPRIKRHKRHGQVCFELLPGGYKAAVMVKARRFPEPPGHYRCSPIATLSQVQEEYKDICLGVDSREGGGGENVLHTMCNKLDMVHVPYFVGSLSIGDYCFFTRKHGGKTTDHNLDYLCPFIIERKSVQDIAMSIHDGRWNNQKRRMYVGQHVFGYDNCRMIYIIEGNENAQTVTGGYVGARWFNVDKDKLNEEIANLKNEGFEVMRTPSRENTMFELARLAKRIARETEAGTLVARYTYAEFKKECSKIGAGVDFSRLAMYHMQQKRLSVETVKRSATEAGVDSDRDIVVMSTPMANSRNEEVPVSASAKSEPPKTLKANDENYHGYSKTDLERECVAVGLPKSGTRPDLIARLKGPHPPKLWLKRKRQGEFVPERHNVSGTALLVALYLHERVVGSDTSGMTKDELYAKAEGLNISKNPFSGGTTQTGPYHYDGWSNMGKLLKGDPALVIKKKNKYKLTRSCDIAGQAIAGAMHTWCHKHNNCPCGIP